MLGLISPARRLRKRVVSVGHTLGATRSPRWSAFTSRYARPAQDTAAAARSVDAHAPRCPAPPRAPALGRLARPPPTAAPTTPPARPAAARARATREVKGGSAYITANGITRVRSHAPKPHAARATSVTSPHAYPRGLQENRASARVAPAPTQGPGPPGPCRTAGPGGLTSAPGASSDTPPAPPPAPPAPPGTSSPSAPGAPPASGAGGRGWSAACLGSRRRGAR